MIKIETKVGNLMNVTAGHIVHGCNAQGVMGSGVALAVTRKFPTAYQAYMTRYNTVGLKLGDAYPVNINSKLILWNAITQDNFGWGLRQVSYDAVQTCFEQVNNFIGEQDRQVPQDVRSPAVAPH